MWGLRARSANRFLSPILSALLALFLCCFFSDHVIRFIVVSDLSVSCIPSINCFLRFCSCFFPLSYSILVLADVLLVDGPHSVNLVSVFLDQLCALRLLDDGLLLHSLIYALLQ